MLRDHHLSCSRSTEPFQKNCESLLDQHLPCLLGIFLIGSALPPKDQCAGEMPRVPPQCFPKPSDKPKADALRLFGPHIGREMEGECGILVVQKAPTLQHDIP